MLPQKKTSYLSIFFFIFFRVAAGKSSVATNGRKREISRRRRHRRDTEKGWEGRKGGGCCFCLLLQPCGGSRDPLCLSPCLLQDILLLIRYKCCSRSAWLGMKGWDLSCVIRGRVRRAAMKGPKTNVLQGGGSSK